MKYLFTFFGLLFLALPVSASELYWQPKNTPSVNNEWQVEFYLNPQGQTINALEGKLSFTDNLRLQRVSDGNSIVNLWAEQEKKDNAYVFGGIIPGGFRGVLSPNSSLPGDGLIFTLIFTPVETGQARIWLEDAVVLLHDGQSTPDQVTTGEIKTEILPTAENDGPAGPEIEDRVKPLKFRPRLVSEPYLYDGRWVLLFQTQDKESGIDHYEVKEGESAWARAGSPYLIKNQDLGFDVLVKAVDQAGNERIAKLVLSPTAADDSVYWQFYVIIILIIILPILVWFYVKYRQKS